ncbi:MAG: asparagine synthase (glutamine-hydrolyzing) [Bacteroidia bacterium]|nr:asparagine synthase (glutamine-hydrolyzing) [Bacteroidia bacterium]
MCGIAGFFDFNLKSTQTHLEQMVNTMNHRGPDDKGVEIYKNSFASVGLGQARLSIIDLSEAGHQPMNYKHFSIVFNGEIYNYQEIREELIKEGHIFKSECDTEVILQAFEKWGIESIHKFIGMFAFAIYDSVLNEITIVRDRAGAKPFYYYWNKGLFLFGSELKALHPHPDFEKKIDQNAVQLYFSQVHHGYIPAPHTIFENTYKLKPGHLIKLNLVNRSLKIESYWEVSTFYKLPKLKIDYESAKIILHHTIKSACEYRMVSDVPVGIFLSGGYDSAAVAAMLQTGRSNKLKTFTIGFEEGNSEAPQAKQTADYLGTDHHEFICTTTEAQQIIPTLPYYFDEPFADSSAIPTMLVSKLARQTVTVALSADAGDEVFGGYSNYIRLNSYLSQMNRIPNYLKPLAKKIGLFASTVIPDNSYILKHKIEGISKALQADDLNQAADLTGFMNSLPKKYHEKLFQNYLRKIDTSNQLDITGFHNSIETAMAIDYQMYLQNDILTKVDRATMSVSLEGREPLLDHRIIEFAAQLPIEYKLDGNTGKKILKDIVHKYIPKELMDRPKRGFTLPIYSWLKKDLSFLIDEYLNNIAVAKSGLFNVDFVEAQVKEFKSGKLHYTTFIWKMLMFQMWYDCWINSKN